MPLDILLDLEVVDSKFDAAFEEQCEKNRKHKPKKRKRFIEDFI